jgi:hypothetical protein
MRYEEQRASERNKETLSEPLNPKWSRAEFLGVEYLAHYVSGTIHDPSPYLARVCPARVGCVRPEHQQQAQGETCKCERLGRAQH